MSEWTKQSRFEAILSGEPADRPAVAAWGHFIPHETDPDALAQATVDFARAYDWDWVKLNPRNTYYAEAWGSRYDYGDYRGAQPRQLQGVVNRPDDIWTIDRTAAGGARSFADQVTVTRLVRRELPDTPVAQTVFSPLTVLLNLAGQPRHVGSEIPGSSSTATLARLIADQPVGLAHALGEITAVLNDYVAELAAAGATAVYYALTSTAHDQIISAEGFAEYSTPYDLSVLDTARQHGLRVILHTCGPRSHPERFGSYRPDALSWDHLAPQNPDLDPAADVVPVGGVGREAVSRGEAAAVRRQAAQVRLDFAGRPLLLAPTCGVGTRLDNPALQALREAVELERAAT